MMCNADKFSASLLTAAQLTVRAPAVLSKRMTFFRPRRIRLVNVAAHPRFGSLAAVTFFVAATFAA